LIVSFSLVAAMAAEEAPRADAADRPNFILCMTDDQGWGDVGYNGHPLVKTPTLDRMAATALRFDRFYSASAVCSPTRGSVMTGRHPNRFGCFCWGYNLRPQEITIAEVLKTAGYATGHFGKWHLGPVTADSPISPGGSGFDEWLSSPNFFEIDPMMSRNGRAMRTRGEGSRVIVDAALEFIRQAAARKQPFLAVVWFGSPHAPYVATDEDRALYKDQPVALQNYCGEITAMDRALGHLRDELRAMSIADNTLLWFNSDNGATGPGSTGGLSGRKGELREGGIRVPAIIEWPAKIKSPAVTAVPCSTVDIYPTLLELAGAKVARQVQPLDGISLVPLLEGRMTSRPEPLGFWTFPAKGRPVKSEELLLELQHQQQSGQPAAAPAEDPGKITEHYPEDVIPRGHAAWMDNSWKLHRLVDKSGKVRYALYDIVKDPEEKEDLAAAQPEQVQRMKVQLEAWQRSVLRSLNGEDYGK
jgi:arylsulfatase A-like enzyme